MSSDRSDGASARPLVPLCGTGESASAPGPGTGSGDGGEVGGGLGGGGEEGGLWHRAGKRYHCRSASRSAFNWLRFRSRSSAAARTSFLKRLPLRRPLCRRLRGVEAGCAAPVNASSGIDPVELARRTPT
jgi:hypothetical protein